MLPQLSFCHLPLSSGVVALRLAVRGSRRLVSTFENSLPEVISCMFYTNGITVLPCSGGRSLVCDWMCVQNRWQACFLSRSVFITVGS